MAKDFYSQPFLPDDHSKVVPPLPIPNRIVKRLSADDSVHSHVKVGHRQALQYGMQCDCTGYIKNPPF